MIWKQIGWEGRVTTDCRIEHLNSVGGACGYLDSEFNDMLAEFVKDKKGHTTRQVFKTEKDTLVQKQHTLIHTKSITELNKI